VPPPSIHGPRTKLPSTTGYIRACSSAPLAQHLPLQHPESPSPYHFVNFAITTQKKQHTTPPQCNSRVLSSPPSPSSPPPPPAAPNFVCHYLREREWFAALTLISATPTSLHTTLLPFSENNCRNNVSVPSIPPPSSSKD
jgi:hypothetical protein